MAGDKNKRPRLKLKEEKRPVNRKLLIFLFLATGAASFFFWWRGKILRDSPPSVEPATGGINIRTTTSPTKLALGQSSSRKIGEEKLVAELEAITATASGHYAVAVYRITDDSNYGFNQSERMPAASIMKVPVMVAVWKEISLGNISLSDIYTLDEADRSTGSGPLQFRPAGSKYSIDELLTYLGKNSDNTAWVMFNRRLTKKKMTESMADMKMSNSSYNDLVITAEDAAKMFRYIYDGNAGGDKGRVAISEYLSGSIYEDRIPAAFSDTDQVSFIHKVGTDEGVWSDVGIVMPEETMKVKPFVIAVLNQDVKRSEAVDMVPDIVKRIWKFEVNSSK